MKHVGWILALLLGPALSAGCGGPDFWAFENITSGSNPGSTLVLVWLSDSPIDQAEAVEVSIEKVELIGPDGPILLSDERRTFDLLALQNGTRTLLAESEVPEGPYDRIRLTLSSTGPFAPRIRIDGVLRPLRFESPAQRVIEVPHTFPAPEGERTEIQMDFNVRLSVSQVGEEWILSPQLNAVDPSAVGEIGGRVLDAVGLPVAGAVLIAQQGGFEVRSTRSAADGSYRITLLLPGRYDVVWQGPAGPLQTEADWVVGLGTSVALDFKQ